MKRSSRRPILLKVIVSENRFSGKTYFYTIGSRLVQEKTSELKQELETAMQQVEELRAARQRQEVMVDSIVVERDMYKGWRGSSVEFGHSSNLHQI